MNPPTILIVDDEPANLTVLHQLLMPNFRVLASKTGKQALQNAMKIPPPDLILLDVMMPEMNGYAVLAELQANEKTRDIPVVFVTTLDGAGDEERGLELGAVDYITKPIKPAIVKARVKAHLEIKFARDRLKSQNIWLEEEVARRMKENLLIQDIVLCALAELAETRDSDTGNHILRTQAYVEALARKLQSHPNFAQELDELNLTRIVKVAPLHDIGKVGIPDHILMKPGKLTAEEWEIMKSHCRIGGDAICHAIERAKGANIGWTPLNKPEALAVLDVAQSIAVSHHEKWDGTGYPDGLAGDAIPLPARLMALADVFDALTTPRVYKKPWTTQDATQLILSEKGKHFDPDIVDAFESILEDFEKIRKSLADPK
ncbi:MAG: response regulator [Desulfamplus sp.]|nr:response regulator [Desulfamplus sp.]